jgi:hypothetical protein
MIEFCLKSLNSRSRFAPIANHRCHREKGHDGKCLEYPYLKDIQKRYKKIADKIKRDSTNTTGASWASDDAGPNRILRWAMLLSDEELLNYELDMSKLRPGIVAKLREKAATYEDCMQVAMKLTWLVYQMPDSPTPPDNIQRYLEKAFQEMTPSSTKCEVCLLPISFNLFSTAQRGKAAIETCHKNPRVHNADNVGFAHRECNIAQGTKTLDEFYAWIEGILDRARRL